MNFFDFFRKSAETHVPHVAEAPAPSKRMTLEERMVFRKEMLYQAIRESFLQMEVIGSMYKFKVMPTDDRHHRFIVMIDVAKSFATDKDHRTRSFLALEKTIRANTYRRFGILLDGVYWRVSETESQFERYSRASDTPGMVPAGRETEPSHASTGANKPLARQGYQPVSDDEVNAFMQAMKSGQPNPTLQVGDAEYCSDLAPLDSGIMIGGTQYGKLN
jgi:hypothetical protein